jgi:hypothetical protein
LGDRIQSGQAAELRTLLESEHLGKKLTLVARDAVQFLRLCESPGLNSGIAGAYVSERIIKEMSEAMAKTIAN